MGIGVKIAGSILLVLACSGAGFSAYICRLRSGKRLNTLAHLFSYWEGLLSYQALAGEELIRRAERYEEFSELKLGRYSRLEELPLGDMKSRELQTEILSGLKQMAGEPRALACTTLHRMAVLCETAAEQRRQEAVRVKSLWPRLGGCAGALIAILLW